MNPATRAKLRSELLNTPGGTTKNTVTANGTWFWHPGAEQHLRSAEEIASLVRTCNARRANYLLDVPPDRTGRIPEAFVQRLQEIGQLLNAKWRWNSAL